MDDLVWDRCPRCLGRLEPMDWGNAQTALGCVECGFAGKSIALPEVVQHLDDGRWSFPGF